jgi:hypothetical protein
MLSGSSVTVLSLKGEQEAILSVSLGECWEPPPEVIQDIPKIFNKILRGAP